MGWIWERLKGFFRGQQLMSVLPGTGDAPFATQYQPLIFLDSNNIHFARLYIDFAGQHRLPPFGNGDAEHQLKQTFMGRTLKSYKTGGNIVTYLIRKCNNEGAQVEYSPITSLEISCGLLKGNALIEAAGQGVTHRMWGRFEEREILERLRPDVYKQISQHTSDLEEQFGKAGIFLRQTDPDHSQDTWALAKVLLGLVYLDVADALVFSSCLLAEADEFLTSDGYLREVAGRIVGADKLREPEKSYYRRVQIGLRDAVAQLIRTTAAEVTLPSIPNSGSVR